MNFIIDMGTLPRPQAVTCGMIFSLEHHIAIIKGKVISPAWSAGIKKMLDKQCDFG
jgi:hypothetical protein